MSIFLWPSFLFSSEGWFFFWYITPTHLFLDSVAFMRACSHQRREEKNNNVTTAITIEKTAYKTERKSFDEFQGYFYNSSAAAAASFVGRPIDLQSCFPLIHTISPVLIFSTCFVRSFFVDSRICTISAGHNEHVFTSENESEREPIAKDFTLLLC